MSWYIYQATHVTILLCVLINNLFIVHTVCPPSPLAPHHPPPPPPPHLSLSLSLSLSSSL